jgi:hypothetical protein
MKFQFIRKKPTLKQRVQILIRLDLQRLKQFNCSAIIRTLDEYETEWLRKDCKAYGVLACLSESHKTRKNKHGLRWIYLTKEEFDYEISMLPDEDQLVIKQI